MTYLSGGLYTFNSYISGGSNLLFIILALPKITVYLSPYAFTTLPHLSHSNMSPHDFFVFCICSMVIIIIITKSLGSMKSIQDCLPKKKKKKQKKKKKKNLEPYSKKMAAIKDITIDLSELVFFILLVLVNLCMKQK